eukprot:9464659-Pyramimonas_sp.AAC.1
MRSRGCHRNGFGGYRMICTCPPSVSAARAAKSRPGPARAASCPPRSGTRSRNHMGLWSETVASESATPQSIVKTSMKPVTNM